MRKWAAVALLFVGGGACGDRIRPTDVTSIPGHEELRVDTSPKERRRFVPPEAYMRTYLQLFGGLAPLDAQTRARGQRVGDLFEEWTAYLEVLGLPDYANDIPRATQTNAVMMAGFDKLGEALCVRAAEHDLHGSPLPPVGERLIFAFEVTAGEPTDAEFAARFDVLHRTFLGYPATLAPPERVQRFAKLYRSVTARHAKAQGALLSPSELGWAAVCAGLIRHPEFILY